MKLSHLLLAAALLLASSSLASAQNANCYSDQGGSAQHIGSGCTLTVESGGALKIGATDMTSTLSAAVAGAAAGYKLARGETALDGSNPTPVTTGLTAITACTVAIKKNSAPGVGTSSITYDTTAGTLNMYGWKVTGTGDATLIASTGTETIGWVCVGS